MPDRTKKIVIPFLLIVFLISPLSVLALEITYPRIPGIEQTPQECSQLDSDQRLGCYVTYFYSLLVALAGFSAFLTIFAGAILYIISFGSVERMKEAKSRISAGFLGLFLVLLSYLILNVLNPQLLILRLALPELPEVPTAPPETVKEGPPVYVEIPLGRLIERVKIMSAVVKYWAHQVWYEGSENSTGSHISLREFAECLKRLTDECSCSIPDTENCGVSGNSCVGQCVGGDPCDTSISSGTRSYCESHGIELESDIVRDAIEELREKTKLKLDDFSETKSNAEKAKGLLASANQKLKIAEALIRDSIYPALNYDAFIAIEEKEIKRLWTFDDLSIPGEDALPVPPQGCSADKPYEIIPSCTICGGTLFCYGNAYRLCATDSRIPKPIDGIYPGLLGCNFHSPGNWSCSPDAFPAGSILYNGETFNIPDWVFICDSNVYGCANTSCSSDSFFSELIDDPANFYIPEAGNEDIIKIVETLIDEALNPVPWPLPDPPDPPPADDALILLDTPTFLQTDPAWRSEYIDLCSDKMGESSGTCSSSTGCGCGPTSTAIILKYFGHNVTPLTIAQQVKDQQEYFCGVGSSVYGLAEMVENKPYEHDYYSISFNDIETALGAGHPMMVSCKNFAGWNTGHINVIRGIGENYIYFQDTIMGRVAYTKDEVRDNFKCWVFYAFKP